MSRVADSGGDGPIWAPGLRHGTAGIEGLSFRQREQPEDFVVHELAPREPKGEGSHLHLWIEKRGISTSAAIRQLARQVGKRPQEFGYAGRKDAWAVTRQWVSIEHVPPAALSGYETEKLRVLRAELDPIKLRAGRLLGNRFELYLRGLPASDFERATEILNQLQRDGVPNYFGPQRFGRSGRAHDLGRLLLLGNAREYLTELTSPAHALVSEATAELRAAVQSGERAPQRRLRHVAHALPYDLARVARQLARRPSNWPSAVRAVDRSARSLQLSALQSRIFNRVLAPRVGSLGRLEVGDLAWLHASGACFAVTEEDREDARLATVELSPSGPLPGRRGDLAGGRPGELERAAIRAEGLSPEDFRRGPQGGQSPRGARRPLRVPLRLLDWMHEAEGARLLFELPAGAYATTVLEEFSKSEGHRAPED